MPDPYLSLPGTSGNYASTPDSVAASITGDLDIRVRVALDDWTPANSNRTLIGKYAGAPNASYLFEVVINGRLLLNHSADGSAIFTPQSTAATGFVDGSLHFVRVTRASASGEVKFYTSEDGVTWSQLGTTVVSNAGNGLFDSTAEVQVGAFNGVSDTLAGKVYRAQVYDGIDGTLVADFNPADGSGTKSSNGPIVSSTTGETWTINQSGNKNPAILVFPSPPGVARRFRKYKGGDGLEKIFPQLRDDEPEVVRTKQAPKSAEKSAPLGDFLLPDGELTFTPPEALDLSLKSPGGVDLSGIDQLARFIRSIPRVVPPTRAQLMRMSIDEFERSSQAHLQRLLNEKNDLMEAVMPRNLNG